MAFPMLLPLLGSNQGNRLTLVRHLTRLNDFILGLIFLCYRIVCLLVNFCGYFELIFGLNYDDS